MASCKFCLNENVDTWFGSWCARCHKLQRMINLFGGEKISNILEHVLLVDEETQHEKIKEELKSELTTREYNLRRKKEKKNKAIDTITE